ncbi:hypothetical protein [Clostridium gelidum]|nr:hypothetical protein [Clostridium gelidum]
MQSNTLNDESYYEVIDMFGGVDMKGDELKVTIIGLEDEKGFSELIAELKVAAVMKMCPPELRMQVLDNALKKLTANQ